MYAVRLSLYAIYTTVYYTKMFTSMYHTLHFTLYLYTYLKSSSLFLSVSAAILNIFVISACEVAKPCVREAINMAAAHIPSGRLPVSIKYIVYMYILCIIMYILYYIYRYMLTIFRVRF